MGVNRWFWKASLGVLLVVVGLLSLIEWPHRIGAFAEAQPDAWILLGALLLALGQFLIAVAASDLAPRADSRIVAFFQLTPLVALVLFGLLWLLL